MNNKNKVLICLCILVFGILGIYLAFFVGNTSKYDSKTKAYDINIIENSDSDSTTYSPIYYFKVNGKDYECKSNTSSSSIPDKSKNIVYYDSKNPEKCTTQYEKSTSRFVGIIIIIVTGLMLYLFIIKKPSLESDKYEEIDPEKQYQLEETTNKIIEVVDKVQLIVKRIILGIIIIVLLVLILIDTVILKQTIKARNYIETIAVYVDRKSTGSVFDDCTYKFNDKEGNEHEIIISIDKETVPEEKVKIKYNKNNPQEYYGEGSTLDKQEIIWYIVKIILMILLIILFFNKKLLNKINISANTNRD